MNENSWEALGVPKLDAARQQLETSISLLFAKADAVSIHTLAFAAFGILKDVSKHRNKRRVLDAMKELADHAPKGEFWSGFNRAGNFFKHAEKDPSSILALSPEENEALISISVEIYCDLGCLITPEIESFRLWWACINFKEVPVAKEPFISWLQENYETLHSESRDKLLDLGSELLGLIKTTQKSSHKGR